MDVDKSIQLQNKTYPYPQNQNFVQPKKWELSPPSGQQPNKVMRVNNLQEDHFLEEDQESSPSSTG